MQSKTVVNAGVSDGRIPGSADYWLIVDRDGIRNRVFTLRSRPGNEILPVFGSEDDAVTFLTPLGTLGDRFTAEPFASRDLAALLRDRLSGIETVALDPAPGIDTGAMLELISVDREGFIEYLTDEDRTLAGTRNRARGAERGVRSWLTLIAFALLGLLLLAPTTAPAQGEANDAVVTEKGLRAAWADPMRTRIELGADVFLRQCRTGDPIRESARPMLLDGKGHTIRQTCFEKRVLRQDGTGYLLLKDVALTRGGSDGPGAAVTTRGEIEVVGSRIQQNLAEEPGGGIFSMRRATIRDSIVTNNLANDDGGGVYARRGGVQVYDSVVSGNIVDGSGGAIGSTGDILLVRSHSDGNTTDGDGGALYTDEDGDVTVVDSTVDGNDADGPGGAIWTLDGDVTAVNSTLNGNRADDRGGAIGGEADVVVMNSTIARNLASAHVGGGIWSRGHLYVGNSTVSNNYAEGAGGGVGGGGIVRLEHATITNNFSAVASNVAAGERLDSFASIVGPTNLALSDDTPPPKASCRVTEAVSFGYNLATHPLCGLDGPDDVVDLDEPGLGFLLENGGFGETYLPEAGSPVLDKIPIEACLSSPFEGIFDASDQHLEGYVDDRVALLAKDQRGVERPQGSACDIGAVELLEQEGAVPQETGPE